MDWSVCKPRARYPLLRPELIYKSQIPVRRVSLSELFNATDNILVLLLCFGTIAGMSLLTSGSNSSLQVSNLCVRFIWLTYIFVGGQYITLSSFIAAMLEMLRRVQWNFCTPSPLSFVSTT